MTFFRHKPGTTRGEALHYWRHQHGPLAASAPGVRRYVQSTVAADEANGSPFDGVAQIWLESDAALGALAASALFRERIKPDEANFVAVEHNLTLAVHEQREVWPAQAGAIACANVDAAQMRRRVSSRRNEEMPCTNIFWFPWMAVPPPNAGCAKHCGSPPSRRPSCICCT
jgi:uncharacterized protein (TIGR02118 family)